MCKCVCVISASLKLTDCRWNFSVGQHQVSFVSRTSSGYDSTPPSQYRDRIAAHSLHDVDESCTKSTANHEKCRDISASDEEDEYSDQCDVQSQ